MTWIYQLINYSIINNNTFDINNCYVDTTISQRLKIVKRHKHEAELLMYRLEYSNLPNTKTF